MAEQCVRSLRESTTHELEIICPVDADPDTAQLLEPLVDVLDVRDEYRGCSQAWNDALALSSGDPVVFAADDLSWGEGWLEHSLELLGEFPDGWGLVGFNDGHWDGHEGLSTHYLMSRRFIVEVLGGAIAWDFYKHSFNDAEVNARARAAGRYAWCENAEVFHAHWIFGDRPRDATDSRTLDSHAASQRIFERRRAAGFPVDYEPVIRS